MSEPKRVALIGGGLVGLSTAYAISARWPDAQIDLFEKEDSVSKHQSGRNSGVIHSGIYYTPGSLKATLCREGRTRLVAFCKTEKITFETCGKLIVATTEAELPRLHHIYDRGQQNGVRCDLVSSTEIKECEPHAVGLQAIFVPDAGIVDYVGVANRLSSILEEKGHRIHLNSPVDVLSDTPTGSELTSRGETHSFDLIVSCGGLHSDRLARMSGAQTDFQIVPFRGVYYQLTSAASHFCRNLIYPVPDPAYPFLGVHFTRMVDGRIEVGPNAVLASAREGYSLKTWNWTDLSEAVRFKGFRQLARNHWRQGVTELHRTLSRNAYVKALQTLVPEIKAEHLEPCRSGIRAQALRSDGSMVDDFVVLEQAHTVHVCNAPSPAATACLSIGESIADRISARMM